MAPAADSKNGEVTENRRRSEQTNHSFWVHESLLILNSHVVKRQWAWLECWVKSCRRLSLLFKALSVSDHCLRERMGSVPATAITVSPLSVCVVQEGGLWRVKGLYFYKPCVLLHVWQWSNCGLVHRERGAFHRQNSKALCYITRHKDKRTGDLNSSSCEVIKKENMNLKSEISSNGFTSVINTEKLHKVAAELIQPGKFLLRLLDAALECVTDLLARLLGSSLVRQHFHLMLSALVLFGPLLSFWVSKFNIFANTNHYLYRWAL